MFPNDDICNIRAARQAAKRIFQRYTQPQQQHQLSSNLYKKIHPISNSLLGESQVQTLMKNAYNAININFTPSSEDISSFMEVFGIDKESKKISLDKMEEMAVKYLCGEESLSMKNIGAGSNRNLKDIQQQINNKNSLKIYCQQDNPMKNNPQIIQNQQKSSISQIKMDNINKTSQKSKNNKINAQQQPRRILEIRTQYKAFENLQSSNNNNNNNNKNSSLNFNHIKYKSPQSIRQKQSQQYFLSPKARIQQSTPTYFSSITKTLPHTQSSTTFHPHSFQLSLSQLFHQCHLLFSTHFSNNNNINHYPISTYKSLLIQSYKLINRNKYKNYNPTDDDIKIWMKLTDCEKNGRIQYKNYQNFMKKLYQREKNIKNV